METLVLLDIDGLIADDRHRQQFAVDKQWNDYFSVANMAADAVWTEGRMLVEWLIRSDSAKIGYLTGRREDTKPVTEAWLATNDFPLFMEPLYMKGLLDKTPTPKMKALKIVELQQDWDQVILYDDDPEVCRIVNEMCGEGTAIHCTWHIKPIEMIRRAET